MNCKHCDKRIVPIGDGIYLHVENKAGHRPEPAESEKPPLSMEMELAPEVPEGVEIKRGNQAHRISGLGNYLLYTPVDTPGLLKFRRTIDVLIAENEKREEQRARSKGSSEIADGRPTAICVLVVLTALLFALCPLRAMAQSRRSPTPDAQGLLETVFPRAAGIFRLIESLSAGRRPTVRQANRFTLNHPCHIGDRIQVSGVYYDCVPPAPTHPPFGLRPLLLTPKDRLYRSRLFWACQNFVPNFAQHYILTTWGCGTDCLMGAAIDTRTERVVWLPFDVIGTLGDPGGGVNPFASHFSPLDFWPQRNLIITHGTLIFDRRVKRGGSFRYRLRHDRFVYDGRSK